MLSVLVTTVGAASAKIALSIWLNSPDLMADATSGVVDSIFGITSDKMTARKTNRIFETISEKIAERFQVIIQVEYPTIEEIEVIEVSTLASETLNRFRITPELLAEKKFR